LQGENHIGTRNN